MTLAQVVLESGWLKHAPCNNFLGIKYVGQGEYCIRKTQEWSPSENRFVWVNAKFQAFNSIEDCMERYAQILMLPRYEDTRNSETWFEATDNVRIDGYATSPRYTESLRKLILRENLYKYDWTLDPDAWITENFQWKEMFSHVWFNGRKYYRIIEPPNDDLKENAFAIMNEAQKLRTYFGKSIYNANGYRIYSYNAHVGGVPKSQHRICTAMNLWRPWSVPMGDFYSKARELTKCTGYGIGNRLLHIDRKDVDRIRVWYYRDY
jgi:hypothetical protein